MTRVFVEKDLGSEYWRHVEFRGENKTVLEYSFRDRSMKYSKKYKLFICESNEHCLLNSICNDHYNCWHLSILRKAIRERKSMKWEIQRRLEL